MVLATPAATRRGCCSLERPNLASLLETIPYNSSITLSLGYRKDTFDHPLKGFGFLVPKRERKLMAACTWVGNKFSYRVPDDMVLLRCFMGGDALAESDESLVAAARRELQAIMGLQAVPVFQSIARWPNSMAQYTVGHESATSRIDSIVERDTGLHLAGNGYRGIGLPDCVKVGKEIAGADHFLI